LWREITTTLYRLEIINVCDISKSFELQARAAPRKLISTKIMD